MAYVVLPSNSSLEYYPNNTLANYKVKLAKPLELDGQHEVALVEMIYPHRRLTVEPDEAYITFHYWKKLPKLRLKRKAEQQTQDVKKTEKQTKATKHRRVKQFKLQAEIYETAEDLLRAINKLGVESLGVFSLEEGKFKVKFGKDTSKMKLSPRMAHLLGFQKAEEPYHAAFSSTAEFLPHFESQNHALYIYSDIVDNQRVGDVIAPLLRVVCPDKQRMGETISEKYIKPYYLPVNKNFIETIDIQIRTTSGHLFPFLSGSPVVLSLHFRRQKHG